MKQIWAPWRMEYILSDKEEGCVFCNKPKENQDDKNYILYRGKTCFVMLNLYPYVCGHIMIVPYKHVPDTTQLSQDELLEVTALLNKSIVVLREAVSPEGFNVGVNIGKIAGAGVEEHVHLHLVPRWAADTNFMPMLSATHVVSESLDDTYQRLKPLFK